MKGFFLDELVIFLYGMIDIFLPLLGLFVYHFLGIFAVLGYLITIFILGYMKARKKFYGREMRQGE